MEEIDKATTTIEKSASQDFITKVDRRDKIVRFVEVTILFIALLFNVFIAIQSSNTQNQIQQNQDANVQRSANRTVQFKAYVSCVLQIPIADRSQDLYDKCDVEASKVVAQ